VQISRRHKQTITVKMAKASRFASLSETELVKLSESKDSKNTKAATKHSVKLFRTYLAEKGHDSSFETYTNGVLNSRLRLFYAEVRNASGERYKRTSLIAIRSGICRLLHFLYLLNILMSILKFCNILFFVIRPFRNKRNLPSHCCHNFG
jgi:hypothetical protein